MFWLLIAHTLSAEGLYMLSMRRQDTPSLPSVCLLFPLQVSGQGYASKLWSPHNALLQVKEVTSVLAEIKWDQTTTCGIHFEILRHLNQEERQSSALTSESRSDMPTTAVFRIYALGLRLQPPSHCRPDILNLLDMGKEKEEERRKKRDRKGMGAFKQIT